MRQHAALLLAIAGCAKAPPPAAPPPSASAPAATPPVAPTTAATATAPAPPPAAVAEPKQPACPAPAPPPAASVPEQRSAQPGDGVWSAFGDAKAGDRAALGEPAIYRTVLHPHPASRFVSVTLAAVDLCRLRVGYVPGKEDVPKVNVPLERGLVPEADRAALVAVFNGGYKPEHGKFGMFAAGTSLVPPRDGACTVGVTSGGGVAISSQAPGSDLVAYRQTPRCLVENGALHPNLVAGDDKPWGGRAKDVVTRRRSAVGIDAGGRFLLYAAGEEASPRELARALLAAGASAGAQLDINWYWTRFLLFGERDGRLAVTSTLIPGMEYQSTGYVERANERDFFYLARRNP